MSEPESIDNILEERAESLKENQLHCDTCGKDTHETKDHGKNGGRRKGAGFPKGKKKQKTLEAMKVKEAFNERIRKHADELFNAQYSLAVGEKVLMVQITRGTGKDRKRWHEIVDDKELIKKYLDDENIDTDEEFYYMTTRPANNQALDSLLNRAMGKVPEKLEVEGGLFSKKRVEFVVRHDDDDRRNSEAGTKPEAGLSDDTPAEPANS